jgi:alkaline phosphatase
MEASGKGCLSIASAPAALGAASCAGRSCGGMWTSKYDLVARIMHYITSYNADPLPTFDPGVDRHHRVLAVVERQHHAFLAALRLLHCKVAKRRRHHTIKRVRRTGTNRVARLFGDGAGRAQARLVRRGVAHAGARKDRASPLRSRAAPDDPFANVCFTTVDRAGAPMRLRRLIANSLHGSGVGAHHNQVYRLRLCGATEGGLRWREVLPHPNRSLTNWEDATYRLKTGIKMGFIGAAGLAAGVAMGGFAYAEEPLVPQVNDPWFKAGQERLQQALLNKPNLNPAKNVIVFIGDGMGVSTVTAARIFEGQQRGEPGEENFLAWEKFPDTALVKTYNTNQQVADSAGTATAWNSGVKAQAGMIGGDSTVKRGVCDSLVGHEARTALELAEVIGMSTGTITSARLTHATPAASYAHVPDRDFEDDAALAKGWQDQSKCKDIARQLIEFPFGDGIEVAMGGGRRHFILKTMKDPEDDPKTGNRTDGRDLTKEWLNKYQNSAYVWNKEQFDAIDPKKVDHLLGLFNRSHMQYDADRVKKDKAGEPLLSELTAKTIDILSKNPKGFYLQVESGRIDHGHHANSAYRALSDAVELSNAVRVALEKVNINETLIIVTADHSHVFTLSGYATRGNPILGKSIGNSSEGGVPTGKYALAIDEKPYTTVGYGNGPGAWKDGTPRPDVTDVDTTDIDYIPQATWARGSETHGGEDVAAWAIGPGAWLIQGTVEQNYLFHVIDHAASLRKRAEAAMK